MEKKIHSSAKEHQASSSPSEEEYHGQRPRHPTSTLAIHRRSRR